MPVDVHFWSEFTEKALERNLLGNARCIGPEVLDQGWAKGRGIVSALEGECEVDGQHLTVRIGLDKYFPLSPPIIFLVPWDRLGYLPHIDSDGYVCYAQEEGLILNRRDPSGIAVEALQRARKVLSDGFEGRNHDDFVDEFQSYWIRLRDVKTIRSFVQPNDTVRKISIAVSDKGYEFVCDSEEAVSDYLNGKPPKHHTIRRGLYLPLRPGFPVAPPYPGSEWTIEKARRIAKEGTAPQGVRALERLTRKWKSEELVVLRLPRPNGGATLFGILFKGVSGAHPLRREGKTRSLVPVAFVRHDKEYLIPRGGGRVKLENKRVALLGCGSVGGYIAVEIARAGISDLTLVDHETFSEENIFRHVLGRSAIGELKVQALKKEIEEKIPYVKVTAIAKRIEEALGGEQVNLDSFDLFITALGKPTIELYLNEKLHGTQGSPPAIFTWLEPYGIGGHTILTNTHQAGAKVPGCLECLFTPVEGDPDSSLYNRSSFAKEGQSFGKNISGCTGLFTPYGALDAMRTAELATRLAVQTLEGSVEGNPILSWKGASTELIEAGFLVSTRYGLSEDQLHAQRYDYISCNCPVCGNMLLCQ